MAVGEIDREVDALPDGYASEIGFAARAWMHSAADWLQHGALLAIDYGFPLIDMHQLTKDPTTVLNAQGTAASPDRTMTRFELTRYLDYCAEMLALIGKIAALFADRMRDGMVIDAANDIEDLTNGLGRKIWQKISILCALDGDEK